MGQYVNRFTLALAMGAFCLGPGVFTAWSQTGGKGGIAINVTDPAGASVPGAQIQLKDLSTNDIRKAETQMSGTYLFPDMAFGEYHLLVAKPGFESQSFEAVQVQTGRTTTINVVLKIGVAQQAVEVIGTSSPIIEPDSSTLSSTVDTKQVVSLPVVGRNVFTIALMVPGWASTSANGTTGTFNNLPGGAIQSVDYDGTPANASRFRSSGYGYGYSAVQPRIENIGEMTVSTAQLDLSGNGTAAMRINLVTRRGTNSLHGRVFEDFRNSALNANTWYNNNHNVKTPILKLNDFGFSLGGPILKNKLFGFGTYAESIQPGVNAANASVLTPQAQQGIYSYLDSTGSVQSVNLMAIAAAAGAPSTVNTSIAGQLAKINSSLSAGSLTPTSDPNILSLNWNVPNRTTQYYPALRFDYYASDKVRLSLSYSQTKQIFDHRYVPIYPGGVDTLDYTSSKSNNKIVGFGVDWTLRPTLINQFHVGYLYQYSVFSPENLGIDLASVTITNFSYGTSLYSNGYPRTTVSSLYSPLSFTDSLTWLRGNHSLTFGGGMFREHDIYWNGPGGFPYVNFGIVSNDPLSAVFTSALSKLNTTQLTNAQNLYAELTGRISAAGLNSPGRPLDPNTKQYKPYGQYNLNEMLNTGNAYAQDRWRLRPNLTLNFGVRWDLVGDDYDVRGGYSSVTSLADFWGPTPVGAIFQPGNLAGVASPTFTARQHIYGTNWKNFQPAVALAWSPEAEGFLGRIFPKGRTVIRTGWSLRSYQEGQQNFWAWGSNAGLFFYQQGSISPDTSGAAGTFQPGTLFLGQTLPAYNLTPTTWSSTVPASALSFGNNSFYGINPHIRDPYVESWNFGIQRELSSGLALEARYVGNMAMHSWVSYNVNERNIFENGFLNEFITAQNNLKINQANGKGNTFINNGLAGQGAMPILQTAFGTATSNFASGSFVTNLQTGAAGSLAGSLLNNVAFFCNMVGSNFSPCVTRGYTTPGKYPVNLFQVNPYPTGGALNYLDAAGHSNYHALQLELRQRLTHGMDFNLNYTLGKSMVLGNVNAYQANAGAAAGSLAGLYLTNRNFRMNYGPSGFDIRHVFHASATYDLPFGKRHRWLNNNAVLDRVVGGWTIGTIFVIQSGSPTQLSGGYLTVNQNDAGVFINGTVSQLQSNVGVYKSGNPWVYTLNPSIVQANGQVNQSLMSPETTPGVWGYRGFVYGPKWWNDDLSLNKSIPIREAIRFTLQAQLLNVFNHPTFNLGALSPQSLSFAQSSSGPTGPRNVEFRANLEF